MGIKLFKYKLRLVCFVLMWDPRDILVSQDFLKKGRRLLFNKTQVSWTYVFNQPISIWMKKTSLYSQWEGTISNEM